MSLHTISVICLGPRSPQAMRNLDVAHTLRFPVIARPDASGDLSPVPEEKHTDEQLLFDIAEGHAESLAILFRRHARSIRHFAKRILRMDAEADDVVQEVFMYLYKKSSIFDPAKGSARSWIFQIAYTQAFLRRRKLKASGYYASGIQDKQAEGHQLGNWGGALYDQSVEGLFGRNGWRKVLESLTEDQRETLRLHFFEGHTFEEIALKLGQSYGNVRNHHYRGLEKVRKHLAGVELNRR
jgi:RNA polymerase sigma-70 factor, ECF subfamily